MAEVVVLVESLGIGCMIAGRLLLRASSLHIVLEQIE